MLNQETQELQRIKFAIGQLLDDSYRCCEIAGQSKEVDYSDLKNQLEFIKAEVQELEDALLTNDKPEQLKECIDVLVTCFGYLQKLQANGANITRALLQVGENNLSKFPKDKDVAMQTVEFYAARAIKTEAVWNAEEKCWVIRDSNNGKYKKPKGYVKVNLQDCFVQ